MDKGIVDSLRGRAGENLDDVLKTSMGGYTKKSVQDYVIQLNKQHHLTNMRFNADIKQLLEEKEAIVQELNQVKALLKRRDAQYQSLTASLDAYKEANGSVDEGADIALLTERLEKQAEEIIAYTDQIKKLNDELVQLKQSGSASKQSLSDTQEELDQSKYNLLEINKRLADEQTTVTKLELEIREKTNLLTEAQYEIKRLREQVNEGMMEQLRVKNAELSVALTGQQDINAQQKAEIERYKDWLESVKEQLSIAEEQCRTNEEQVVRLQDALKLVGDQNKRQEAYQKELTAKLQALFEENLAAMETRAELQLEVTQLNEKLVALGNNINKVP